jgi:hypothetical protein
MMFAATVIPIWLPTGQGDEKEKKKILIADWLMSDGRGEQVT